jgi:hypothetical protein
VSVSSSATCAEHGPGICVSAADLRLGETDRQHERHQPLLGAVVEVSLDPPPRGVAGLDDATARGRELLTCLGVGDRLRDQFGEVSQPRFGAGRQRLLARPRGPDHPPPPSADGDRRRGRRPDPQPADRLILRRQLAGLGARRSAGRQRSLGRGRALDVERQSDRDPMLGRSAPAGNDLAALAVAANEARDVRVEQQADRACDAVEHLLLRRLGRDERRDPAQRRLLRGERPVRRLALAQCALVAAPLDLRGGPRGEDPQRGQVLVVGVE